MSQSVADKIDELLKDDRNFSTRAGVRFLTEVIKDAIRVIEGAETTIQASKKRQDDIDSRLKHVEKWQEDFLALREKEQEKAETERTWWRRAIFAPMIVMVLSELAQWLLNKP